MKRALKQGLQKYEVKVTPGKELNIPVMQDAKKKKFCADVLIDADILKDVTKAAIIYKLCCNYITAQIS